MALENEAKFHVVKEDRLYIVNHRDFSVSRYVKNNVEAVKVFFSPLVRFHGR